MRTAHLLTVSCSVGGLPNPPPPDADPPLDTDPLDADPIGCRPPWSCDL